MSFFSKIKNFEYKDFLDRLYNRIFEEGIFNSSAQVAFYFAFALFPFLLFLISLFGLVLDTADQLRQELFWYLGQIMPASAYDLVRNTIKEVTENSSGGKLTIGLVIALWSASVGIDNIRIALNSVYNLKEKRSYVKTKLLSLVMTLALTVFVMIALGIILYGSQLLTFILSSLSLPIPPPFVLGILQVSTILLVLIISFGLIYNYTPSYDNPHWVWITPGTVTGIALWLLVSTAFRIYLQYFDSYAKTYGSLGAVIILMLWLYLTAVVILVGGLTNSIFENMSRDNELTDGQEDEDPKKKQKVDNQEPADTTVVEKPSDPRVINKVNDLPITVSGYTDQNVKHDLIERETAIESNNKPILNLMIGTVFGIFAGLMYSKKKRDDS